MANLNSYLASLKNHAEISEDIAEEYFRNIQKYRDLLIKGNLKLVVKLAFQVFKGWKNVELDDLIQEGNVGLMQAIDKFDVTKGYKFSTFATWRIQGQMLDYIRNTTGIIKTGTTKTQREIFNNIGQIKKQLEQEGCDILDVAQQYCTTEFEITSAISGGDVSYIDDVPEEEMLTTDSPESIYIKRESLTHMQRKIVQFRDTLTSDEKFIWDNRIVNKNNTTRECASILQISSPQTISNMESRILEKAKGYFDYWDMKLITEQELL